MDTTRQGPNASSYVVPGAWLTDEEMSPNTSENPELPPYDEITNGRLAHTIVGYKAILLVTTKLPTAWASIERIEEQYALCAPDRLEVFGRIAKMKLGATAGILIRVLQLLVTVKQRCEDRDVIMRVNMLLDQVRAMEPPIRQLHDQLLRDEETFRAVGVF